MWYYFSALLLYLVYFFFFLFLLIAPLSPLSVNFKEEEGRVVYVYYFRLFILVLYNCKSFCFFFPPSLVCVFVCVRFVC
jgi:hypothetical protein